MALREAVGNAVKLSVQVGSLAQSCPTVKIGLTNDTAQFSVTGGLNYVPVTFTGASTYQNPVVEELAGFAWFVIDQSVNGRDFWQADYNSATLRWDLTYNLRLGSDGYQDIAALLARPQTRTFRFRNPSSLMWQISSLAVRASPGRPSVYGQPVAFSAAVQADGATAPGATGTVVFSVDGTPVATQAVVSGVAFCTNLALRVGTRGIQASYSGDNTFTASSNSLTHVVNPGASTVSYSGATFVYSGAPQGPAITFSGSSGAKTTNYVGTGGTVYAGPTPPSQVGGYLVTNTVALADDYLATNAWFSFAIIPVQTPIVFTNVVQQGAGVLQVSGAGPAGQAWRLLATTNLALPWMQWTVEASNSFLGSGQFSYAIPVSTNAGAKFYRLVSP